MKYKVASTNNFQRDSALKLATDFGLIPAFSVDEITEVWMTYSVSFGAFWLEPNKEMVEEMVEEAFGITLEEVPGAKIRELK